MKETVEESGDKEGEDIRSTTIMKETEARKTIKEALIDALNEPGVFLECFYYPLYLGKFLEWE